MESWEKETAEFLSTKLKIRQDKIPHYIKWISKFISETDTNGDFLHIKEKFIDRMSTTYPGWQVEQASKAIAVYINQLKI